MRPNSVTVPPDGNILPSEVLSVIAALTADGDSPVLTGLTRTSIAAGAEALGTTQQTAYPIVAQATQFTTVPAGAGAVLPAADNYGIPIVGGMFVIINSSGAALLLYPPPGGSIDANNANVPNTVPALSTVVITATAPSTYATLIQPLPPLAGGAGTGTKIFYDAYGRVTGSTALGTGDLPAAFVEQVANAVPLAGATMEGALNLAHGGDVGVATVAVGPLTRTMSAHLRDVASVADYLTTGDLGAALNAMFTAGLTRIFIPPGSYTLSTPAVATVSTDFALFTEGLGTVDITVRTTQPAIQITQQNVAMPTVIRGIRLIGGTGLGAPIAAGFQLRIGGAPTQGTGQQVLVAECECIPNPAAEASAAPYPGTWTIGFDIQAVAPELVGLVRIVRCHVQNGNLAGPAVPNSYGFQIGRLDDFITADCSCTYASSHFHFVDYCEGWRFFNITCVGCDHYVTQNAATMTNPLGNGLYMQKIYGNNFEINTYLDAWVVANVSDSWLQGGEVVRYADSGAGNWTAYALDLCFTWHLVDMSVDGLAGTGGQAAKLSASTAGAQFNALHVWSNGYIIRCTTGIELDAQVAFCRLTGLGMFSISGWQYAFVDNSGNTTNYLHCYLGFGTPVTNQASWVFANKAGLPSLVINTSGTQDVGLYLTPGASGQGYFLEAVNETTGNAENIVVQSDLLLTGAKVQNLLAFSANAVEITQVPTGPLAVLANTSFIIVLSTIGNVASVTLDLPANQPDGLVQFATNVTITALTLAPATGDVLYGAPSTMAPDAPFSLLKSGTNWWRVG